MIIEARIPKGWGEVSLAKFEELTKAMSESEANPWIVTAKMISVLAGIDYTEVKTWPVTVLQSNELLAALEFVKKDPKKRMPSEKITLAGKQYDLYLYPQKWSAGQWLDYTTISKDESEIRKMSRLIACFTVPKGKQYGKDYDFDEVVNVIDENMDIETALGLSGFFQLQFDAFTKALLDYSAKKMKKARKSIRKAGSRSNKTSRQTRTQDTPQSGQAS